MKIIKILNFQLKIMELACPHQNLHGDGKPEVKKQEQENIPTSIWLRIGVVSKRQ